MTAVTGVLCMASGVAARVMPEPLVTSYLVAFRTPLAMRRLNVSLMQFSIS